MSNVLNEQLRAGAFIVSEEENYYSRDAVAVDASAALVAGTVLGQKGIPADEAAVAAAAAGNTGNGVITMDATAPIAPQAVGGVYQVVFRDATHFEVIAPNGVTDGFGVVGATYNGAIKFAIAAGGVAFVEGDRELITVTQADPAALQFEPLNPAATDGTQFAAAVLVHPIDSLEVSAGTTVQKTVLRRQSQVTAADLTWPAGITAAQLAAATEQLAARGIILR